VRPKTALFSAYSCEQRGVLAQDEHCIEKAKRKKKQKEQSSGCSALFAFFYTICSYLKIEQNS
jgi:hypothetical protein